LAAELKQAFGVEAELKVGSPGAFEVIVDGRNVYSKDATGRFPVTGEVMQAIRARQ
jgi:selT/selW/selH-like putative selenoprotein